jgi:ABC-type sulfate transport system permease component
VGDLHGAAVVTLPFVVGRCSRCLELDTDMEEAALARRLGAHRLPADRPAEHHARDPVGIALAFARAVGEIGMVVLISGNNRSTPVASVSSSTRYSGQRAAGASVGSFCS